ncbi:MAG TPA: HAMP domain-containing sensor histidine kinase [Thermoanaerobaculia bacterium]|nr:HAMP domain-containing sensor histidine kinase [Thermoanaerobaculia bacterium]
MSDDPTTRPPPEPHAGAPAEGVVRPFPPAPRHVQEAQALEQKFQELRDADSGAVVHLDGRIDAGQRFAELRRQADERAARQAQEASRLKSDFLATLSHELLAPLNAVIGFAELMQGGKAGPLSGDQREYLGSILDGSRHVVRLLHDVVDLAKIEAGLMEIRPERVRLAELAAEVRDGLAGMAARRRIFVALDVRPGIEEAVIDPEKLKQVLHSFLSNALRFSLEGSRVFVRLAPEGADEFRLEVEDRGPGIRPEDTARLFVEFQRPATAAGGRRRGLGLALTRRIVEAQGGRVGVKSQWGQGSLFFAVLPRHAGAPPVDSGTA